MRQYLSAFTAIVAVTFLGACTSGTTYGTGTSHEEQTFNGLANLLSLKADDAPDIDYSARPDLVMPSQKELLPAPVDTQTTGQEDWPESPEQRITAVRESAYQEDLKKGRQSGLLPTEYLLSEKVGTTRVGTLGKRGRTVKGRGEDELLLKDVQSGSESGTSESVRRQREQLAYSTGVKRKYLTEPPTEYRTPSANAETGDYGIDNQEIAAAERKRRAATRNQDRDLVE